MRDSICTVDNAAPKLTQIKPPKIKQYFGIFLLFCIFAIPFSPQGFGVYLGYGFPQIDMPRMLMFLLIGFYLINKITCDRKINIKLDIITGSFLLLIIFQFFSIFATESHMYSFLQWVGYTFYYYFIYFIIVDTFKDDTDYQKVITILVHLSFCLGILSFYEFFLGKGMYDNLRFSWQNNPYASFTHPGKGIGYKFGFVSTYGPFSQAVPLAYLFASTFFLAFYKFVASKKNSGRLLFYVILLTISHSMFFTSSRAAIIAVVIVFIVSLFFIRKYINILFYTLVFLSLMALPIFTISLNKVDADNSTSSSLTKNMPNSSGEKSISNSIAVEKKDVNKSLDILHETFISKIYYDKDHPTPYREGAYGRLHANWDALGQILKKPIFGYGTGSVGNHKRIKSDATTITDISLFALIGLESGLIAMCAILLMLFSTLWLLFKRFYKKVLEINKLTIFLFCSILTFMICVLSSPQLESSFVFFLILGVANIVIKQIDIEPIK